MRKPTREELEASKASLSRDNSLLYAGLQAAVEKRLRWFKTVRHDACQYRFALIDPLAAHGGILLTRFSCDSTGQKPSTTAQYLDDARAWIAGLIGTPSYSALAPAIHEAVQIRNNAEEQERKERTAAA